jgi:AraC family transcriptional regulator of adaptative response / DNA-3-methyladenine glycosylase II
MSVKMAPPAIPALSREALLARREACDREDDGKFIVGVRTTGIYCLPSCRPPRRAKPENITFYASPEEARAAGLRACKLCRPDEFYLGQFAGETLIEGLVAGLALDPGAYRNVGALAAVAGVSQTKLHELTRTHYHTTPADLLARARVTAARRMLLHGRRPVAEIAFEVGFESLSAFNDNFRKYTALSAGRYRRLPEQPEFTLTLPDDYPIGRILAYLGRDRASLTERVEGSTWTGAYRLGAGAVVARVTFEPGAAHCRVVVPSALDAEAAALVHERILATLGLTSDPLRFEAQVSSSPELAPLIDGQRGLRVPLLADPFDGLVWAIVGQQINLPFAYTLRRRLIERVSRPAGEGLYVPPAPEAVAALEVEALLPLSFSRAKAGYLIGAARSVVDGRLPLEALAGVSATRIERTLRAVRGIGPWSAHYMMMRSFGFLDCVPLGDVVLLSSLKQFFALDERPGKSETLALMERFSPYRSLAAFHLWQRHGTAA